MSPAQKRLVRTSVITTAIGLLGLALTWAVTTGAQAIVTRPEYDLHLQADSLWKVEQREMTLDVLCSPAIDPDNRRCR